MPTTESTTTARIDWKTFQDIVPEMGTGMAAVSHALRKSGIEPELLEMIKVRVSQLNGCAFCIQYHLNDARKLNLSAPSSTCLPRGAKPAFTQRAKRPLSNGLSALPFSPFIRSPTNGTPASPRNSLNAKLHF